MEQFEVAQTERGQYKASVLEAGEEMYGYERQTALSLPSVPTLRKCIILSTTVRVSSFHNTAKKWDRFTLRKIQIFGIRLDSVSHQYNYLIDENQTIGMDGKSTHGPDSVLSMLHHCLYKYGFGEKSCVKHADNCAGQNKNRYVLAYLCWRIHQGLHSDIILQMQVPGHTNDCDSVEQLADIVGKSAESTARMVVSKTGPGMTGNKSFLQEKFLPLKGIRKFQVCRFTDRDKGAVYVRTKSGAPEVRIELVKRGAEIRFGVYPEMLRPGGLSAARQEYLYKNVRQFVRQRVEICYAQYLRKNEI